jgi:hypothetical protein
MILNLLLAIVALAVWAFLTFVKGSQTGFIHLLLGVGTVLLVRWWALRA